MMEFTNEEIRKLLDDDKLTDSERVSVALAEATAASCNNDWCELN